MLKRSLILAMLIFIIDILSGAIGTAETISEIEHPIQFGGRQSVYANGDTIAFCYMWHYGMYPGEYNTGFVRYVYSFDGGQTFQSSSIGASIDGAPTLFKDGDTVIITNSRYGGIWRWISQNNGANFVSENLPPFYPTELGSDRLPITDKYDGKYHSLYAYKDFTSRYFELESPYSKSYGTYTDNDRTSNDTPAYYWGPDVVYGTVRVNGDLWIKQLGGGTNNGWPTFYGPVIVSGNIQSYSGTPPYAQVFRGGDWENFPGVEFNTATVQQQFDSEALLIGTTESVPNLITMVTVDGNNFSSLLGQIAVTGTDTLWVYSDYPPGNGAPLYANVIPHVDTLWTPGPFGSTIGNTKFMVNTPLWIKGTFSGTQAWYSPYNVFLMDGITLTNTPVGQCPDGTVTGSTYNSTDKVAIVSGKNIYIQYGYKDPVTSNRMKPNCDGGQQGIWIYASLYALGDGHGNPHEDGVFTFEYQHPHPSVPATVIDTTLYDNIDLHRRTYPQTGIDPWPGNIDYPYYNPLWPEGNPTMERGTVHIWGSIIQRRRGFMHRGLVDSEYPNPTNVWDTDVDFCGGPAGNAYFDSVLNTTFSPVNAPNTTGSGIGYIKDIHFDSRIKSETFGINPWNFGICLDSTSTIGDWQAETFMPLNIDMVTKTYERKFGQILFSINNRLFRIQNSVITELHINNAPEGNIFQINLLDADNALIYVHDKNIGFNDTSYTPDAFHVFNLNLTSGNYTTISEGIAFSEMNDIQVLNNGLKVYAQANTANDVTLYAITQDNQLLQLSTWNPNQPLLSDNTYDFSKARLTIEPSTTDSFYVFIWLPLKDPAFPFRPYLTNGTLLLARGSFANTGIDDNTQVTSPDLKPTLSISPNPFRSMTTITVNLPKSSNLSVKIYNVKGELIKSYKNDYKIAGNHKLTWDGRDNHSKAVSSGIYYYRCETDRDRLTGKMVLLK